MRDSNLLAGNSAQRQFNDGLFDKEISLKVAGHTRVLDLTVNDLQFIIQNVIEDRLSKETPTKEQVEDADMITRDQAKDLIKCAYPKLHRLMRDGSIVFWKAGHRTIISRQSVLDYIKSN